MKKLPILKIPDRDNPCCCRTEGENTYTVYNIPDFTEITAVDSRISGGYFLEYLKHRKETFGAGCLILSPLRHIFSIPCYLGCGDATEQDIAEYEGSYSSALMCRYCYDREKHTVILYDDAETLNEKAAAALELGYEYLAADPEIIKKIRLPE